MLTCDEYHMPTTLSAALADLQAAPEGSRLVAGATDILPWAREGRAGNVNLPAMIDLSRIDELHGYDIVDGRVRLGANIVYQQFLTDPVLREHLPAMPYCSIWFADDQIREQATLAGNLVNASPAADGTPPMLAHNAVLELARLEGSTLKRRTIALADFVRGPGKTDLGHHEIVTAITCDSLSGYGGSFQKVGQRRSLVISSVCAAACIKMDKAGEVVEDIRLALGGVGPVPMRLDDIETMLRGKRLTADLVTRASAKPVERVASRTRRQYRRTVVKGFIEAAVQEALIHGGARLPGFAERENAHV